MTDEGIMPAMPRIEKSDGTKVAYKILGVPQNLAHKPNAEQRFINKRLNYEETFRVR